ncbi:MAG TPA: NADPH-dependent FMN reductase [Gemmatimonadales bacterium]
MRILAISGSLRAASSNSRLLEAAAALAPAGVAWVRYEGLGELPHFNPDIEARGLPAPVAALRAQVAAAGAIVISSPEYAHGVPGSLKNALDWLVSGVELPGKPVALFNPSATSTHAQAALVEILTTMSARVIADATVTLPLGAKKLEVAGMIADPAIAAAIRAAIAALRKA